MIGKYSALAVSDVVYISDYHNGVVYNYIIVKENGVITTNFLASNPTEEHNGLQIKVPIDVKSNRTEIDEALASLTFFPNLYIDSNLNFINFSDIKVVRRNNYSISSINYTSDYKRSMWVLLGNVLYPLEHDKLDIDSTLINPSLLSSLIANNICINVNIGEINVTPNRESIIYSEKTIKVLSERLKQAAVEILDDISKISNIDIDDLGVYTDMIKNQHYYHPLTNTIDDNIAKGIPCTANITYKGVNKTDDFNEVLKYCSYNEIPGYKNICTRGALKNTTKFSYSKYGKMLNHKLTYIAIEDNKNITGYTKRFILDNPKFHDIGIINYYSREDFKRVLLSTVGTYNGVMRKDTPDVQEALDEVYEYCDSKTTIIPLKDIKDYKERLKAELPATSKNVNSLLFTLHKYQFTYSGITDEVLTHNGGSTYANVIRLIVKQGKCIVLLGRDRAADDFNQLKLLNFLGYSILWCSNKLYDKLFNEVQSHLANNVKFLNNVFFDVEHILENPTKSTEIRLVVGRFILNNINVDDYIIDTWKDIYRYFKYDENLVKLILNMNVSRENLKLLAGNPIYKNYTIKHPLAVSLQEYLDNMIKYVKLYVEQREELDTINISGYSLEQVSLYKILKRCIKSCNINLNYSNYLKLKNYKTIKLLYNE